MVEKARNVAVRLGVDDCFVAAEPRRLCRLLGRRAGGNGDVFTHNKSVAIVVGGGGVVVVMFLPSIRRASIAALQLL